MTTAPPTTPTTVTTVTTTERRRFRAGVRTRVLGLAAALLAGALVVGLVAQRAVLLGRLDDDVEALLDQEREELDALVGGVDPATGEPFAGDVRAIFDTFLARNVPGEGEVFLTFVDGAPYKATRAPVRLDADPALVARWTALTTGERGRVDTAAGPVRYLAVPLQSGGETRGVFVVANFVRGEREEIETSIRVAAVIGGVVLLAALGVAWVAAGRVLRPLRDVRDTAQAISESDLSRRIPVEGDDEIADLAHTFNAMLDRLEEAFVAQRAFVDDAGHELRTPITVIRGHLELMGDDPAERAETLALVGDELDRMARIVDDLLLLAKAEQPDFLRPAPTDVAQLTLELLAKAQALGERHWVLDGVADVTAVLDEQRVTQAVLNLARNAVEHTAPGDEIGLGSARRDGVVALWVRDRGPGIAPADQQRVFERFTRARGTRRRSDGAGLGLAIVHAIAEAHGGRVLLTSAVGAGARFTLELPAGRPPAGPPPAGPPPAPRRTEVPPCPGS
ncbi:MAG: two-component sensor histidine kinase [Acidimicrobiia bacterium]|nr:MAG: two-component sensor histidine kinase [Acidimicrobiia bacterium]